MLDWKCLLRSSTQSALVGHGRVYLGSGFGEGHVPYGEIAWQRGKERVFSAYGNQICPKTSVCPLFVSL